MEDVARHFARALFDEITSKAEVTMVLPVGPVDQFPILARLINDARLDCREVVIINMDEYLVLCENSANPRFARFRGLAGWHPSRSRPTSGTLVDVASAP